MKAWSLDEIVDLYNSSLRCLADAHAPLKETKITMCAKSPWYNDEVRSAKRIRRRLERQWTKTRSLFDHQAYRKHCALLNKLIRKAKSDFNFQIIQKAGKDQKQLYKACNFLLGKNNAPKLPSFATGRELACSFNTFFTEKVKTIVQSFGPAEICNDLPNSSSTVSCQFSNFSTLTESEVRRLITSYSTKTCKLDPIPTDILKNCIDNLIQIITLIVNKSLVSGQFPTAFKQPIVRPSLKKTNPDCEQMKNYRPVSNLPFISKIIEKAVLQQLLEYFDKNGLHDPCQSAYRKQYSTETAMVRLTNDILVTLDQGKAVLVVFLDVSAAFDTVNHNMLLHRLHSEYGITGKALQWFASYLSGRSQVVEIDGHTSDPRTLEEGFPQGSVLGGVLYSWTVKPLTGICRELNVNHQKYADDKTAYISFIPRDSVSKADAMRTLEVCLTNIGDWMLKNRVQLNSDKTKMLIISSKADMKHLHDINSINFNGDTIKPRKHVRLLGMELDQNLKLERQINLTTRTIYSKIRNIWRIRNTLNDFALKSIVNSVITSRLDYYNSTYDGLPANLVKKLQRAQNSAARLVMRLPKYCRITPVLKDLHWLPVKYRISFKICTLVYRALNNSAPDYIINLLILNNAGNLRSSSAKLFKVPRSQTVRYGDRSFQYSAPQQWNKLPFAIRSADSLNLFKKLLKTHMFRIAFDNV